METTKDSFGYPIYRSASKSESTDPTVPKNGFTLFGEEQEVAAAFEPSNIIWENLEIPVKTRNRNKCKVFLIVSFLLLIILLAVAYLKVLATKEKLKYPQSYECETYAIMNTDDGMTIPD